MIKYLGSKRLLLPLITGVVNAIPDAHSVIDLFSGTSRVGHALKAEGFQVFSNDLNTYAATLARCYVQADRERHARMAQTLLDEFGRLPGKAGYFTETFCVQSRFFQPKNGEKIDAIRDAIAAKGLEPELEAVVLVSLMEAADRVDSTTGVQMAYLKKWAARSHQPLSLRLPNILPRAAAGAGRAHQMDALAAAQQLRADVAYLDPPYNQHKYLSNYHIWETLVRWDAPEQYGVACKRVDCRERKSPYNSRPRARAAFERLIEAIQARVLVVSFNNEGFLPRSDMEEMLKKRGHVQVIERDFRRYVGAQIGVYNPGGKKVGTTSHLRNKEFVYVASAEPLTLSAVGS